jgi:hypothetical protein
MAEWVVAVLSDQVTSLDWRIRRAKKKTTVSTEVMLHKTGHGWACELIFVPYDHESMAVLADRRARHDWAYALRTDRIPPLFLVRSGIRTLARRLFNSAAAGTCALALSFLQCRH